LKAGSIDKSLNQQKADSGGKLVSLRCCPAMDVLKQSGHSRFFKRTLKILITEKGCKGKPQRLKGGQTA